MPYKFNDIFGWFDFSDIYNTMTDKFDNCLFIEIGSFQGKSAIYMGESIKEKKKNIKLVCVDLFPTNFELEKWERDGAGQGAEAGIIKSLPDGLLNTFVRNTVEAGVDDVIIPIKSSSHKAIVLFNDNSIPFIFVDAGHGYETVKKDLELWWEKVSYGGVMAGHDFYGDVERAVNDFFKEKGVEVERWGGSWLVNKDKSVSNEV